MSKRFPKLRSPLLLAALIVPAMLAVASGTASAAGPASVKSADSAMLNPQPLPPRYRQRLRLRSPWLWRALNPQPLPPSPCRCPNYRVVR